MHQLRLRRCPNRPVPGTSLVRRRRKTGSPHIAIRIPSAAAAFRSAGVSAESNGLRCGGITQPTRRHGLMALPFAPASGLSHSDMLASRVLPRRRVGARSRHSLQRRELQRQRDRRVDEAGGTVGQAVGGRGRGLRQLPGDLRRAASEPPSTAPSRVKNAALPSRSSAIRVPPSWTRRWCRRQSRIVLARLVSPPSAQCFTWCASVKRLAHPG